jgi:hypothetical protein
LEFCLLAIALAVTEANDGDNLLRSSWIWACSDRSFYIETVLSQVEVTHADIDFVVDRIGNSMLTIGRAGANAAPHRRDPQRRHIVEPDLPACRAVYGTTDIIKDLIEGGKSSADPGTAWGG